MPNFILIFLCLIIGFLLKRSTRFPKNAHLTMNAFVITLALPSLVLVQVSNLMKTLEVHESLLVPVSMAWLAFALAFILINWIGKRAHWDSGIIGALILTAGLGNTSFVGFPILEALFGAEGLSIGIIVDQLGTFLAVSTIGLVVAASYSVTKKTNLRGILRNIFRFPPFIALLAATGLGLLKIEISPVLMKVLEKMGATLVPLALVSVGFQLNVNRDVLRRKWNPLVVGLGIKLFLTPLLLGILYLEVFHQRGLSVHVTVLEASMAPMITASVVASEFHLDDEVANLMVGVGIPLSLGTVLLWNEVFKWWLA